MELFFIDMLREVKTIYLYLKLDYRKAGTGEYLDEDGVWKPVPAGWFYKCLEYKFNDKWDVSSDPSSPYNKETKDFDRPLLAKDKTYILDQLKKHNDEQLKLLFSEIDYWQSNLAVTSNPRFQKIIQFYEIVLDEFKFWYDELGLKFPGKPVTDSSIDSKVENPEDSKPNKNVSKIDQEIEAIEKAVSYINDEIKKLGSEYIRTDIILICATAYEIYFPIEKEKKSISVTKFSKKIFPEINHKIKKWKLSQFQSFLRPHLTLPKKKTKVPKMLGIFFL
jgi:hypothetical protein